MSKNKNLSYLFGARLCRLREAMKFNQKTMAEMLGLPAYLLNRYEKGNNGSLPRVSRIQMLAQFFNAPIDWLLEPKDNSDKPLPIDEEQVSSIKSKSYLRLALRCSNFTEENIPEMVEELVHTVETLRKWTDKKENKAGK